MAEHNDFGKMGESMALAYLRSKGIEIIELNWHYKKYEIDIIAKEGNLLLIIEVKTRRTNYFGEPEEFVKRSKQKQLIEGANAFLELKKRSEEIRFDIISVLYNTHTSKINHIPNAYTAIA
jgi:putative endonuclease